MPVKLAQNECYNFYKSKSFFPGTLIISTRFIIRRIQSTIPFYFVRISYQRSCTIQTALCKHDNENPFIEAERSERTPSPNLFYCTEYFELSLGVWHEEHSKEEKEGYTKVKIYQPIFKLFLGSAPIRYPLEMVARTIMTIAHLTRKVIFHTKSKHKASCMGPIEYTPQI